EQLAAMLRRGEPRRDPQLTARRHRQRQQADHELITQFLPDVRYVHLTRADKVAQAISWHRALQTLDWWDLGRPRPARAGTDPQFDGDAIEQLESRLRADEWRWVSYFADVGVQPIIVTYESLSSDYEGTIRSVAAQLGVDTDDREIPQPKLRRQSDTISKKWHSSYLRRRNRRIQRLHRSLPPVSVIVVSHNEGENLRRTVDVLSATVP